MNGLTYFKKLRYRKMSEEIQYKCPLKVNPYILEFLTPSEKQMLEDYIVLINCEKVGLNVLNDEDKEKFSDLIFKLNLIEVGLA